MAKPQRGKVAAIAPSADQIAAVRRLASHGDATQARQRLAALRKSYPAFKPLLALAWEIEDRCGAPMLAAARALEWSRGSQGSRAALEALCGSARQAGMAAVYARALGRLSLMDGEGAQILPPEIDTPFGSLTLEQAEAIDLSRMHLEDDDPAAAASVLEGLDHPAARNNLALAFFIGGDVARAREVVESNWQRDPDNLFALERAIRWRCWNEGLDRCLGFTATLLNTKPRRADDAIARVAALRFLGDAQAARTAWDDSAKASFWKTAADAQRAMFDDLGEADAELAGDTASWFPGDWMRAVRSLASKVRGPGDSPEQQRLNDHLEACDAHADYLGRAAEVGGDMIRELAVAILERRALRGDDACRGTLTNLLGRPCGPDSVRMDILNWLIEQGFRQREDPAEVWLNGEVREIRSHGFNITREPKPSPYPPEGTAINERMHAAIKRDDLDEALALALRLVESYPREPSAYTNLAAIKEGLDAAPAEVTALYARAHELAPEYLFARCGYARCLAKEGRLEQARKLLDGLLDRTDWHYSEYRSFLLTQHVMAVASGEHDAARALEDSLVELERGFSE